MVVIDTSFIKFDKKGELIGKYYGVCPICKLKSNLVSLKGEVWMCRWCYRGRVRKNE